MRYISNALIVALLQVMIISIPANAQNLWKIYSDKEKVIIILETRQNWKATNLTNYQHMLNRQLALRSTTSLDPMFPNAPPIKDLFEIYGFEPRYDLRNFYTLTILASEKVLQDYKNPFEFARKLQTEILRQNPFKMKSVEPDLPLSAYPPASVLSSSNCPDKEKSPIDRAWPLRNMKVSKAWELSKGSGEKIGHPDTGYSVHVDLDNEALEKDKKNNFIEKDQLPIDPLPPSTILTHPGHGTSTGSVIISRGNMTDSPPTNTEGGTTGPGKVTGIACEAELVPYRAIKSVVRFTYSNIEKAIYKAVNDGCSVISLSLGGVGHNALNAAMEYAIGKNVIIIAAAGNVPGISVVYPAKYPFCIAVAANNINDKPWKGSTYGKEVTISAPGESVWRAFRSKPDEDTKIVEPSCGTSYSTASTAGVAALWLSHHKRDKLIKQFDPDTKLQFIFKNLLKKNARRPNGWEAKKYGAGIVNAGKLLKADPDSVRKDSIDDYSEFKKRKRRAAEDNLTAVEQMFEQLKAF